jgi:hypothetical protein
MLLNMPTATSHGKRRFGMGLISRSVVSRRNEPYLLLLGVTALLYVVVSTEGNHFQQLTYHSFLMEKLVCFTNIETCVKMRLKRIWRLLVWGRGEEASIYSGTKRLFCPSCCVIFFGVLSIPSHETRAWGIGGACCTTILEWYVFKPYVGQSVTHRFVLSVTSNLSPTPTTLQPMWLSMSNFWQGGTCQFFAVAVCLDLW